MCFFEKELTNDRDVSFFIHVLVEGVSIFGMAWRKAFED
jgi:hypothetical protein